jgi:hypothetical protein
MPKQETARPMPAAPPAPKTAPSVTLPTVDLVLGIDLGTSCTKVVIGDPGWKDRYLAVPFGEKKDITAWLFPTRFDGESNLKMRLMDEPDSAANVYRLACYLADVIRRSQDWFKENGPADYRRRSAEWRVNLGFPEKSIAPSQLATAYSRVGALAMQLAASSGDITQVRAANLARSGRNLAETVTSGRLQIYPEIAAQLAGYVNSPYRKQGSLLLVDVGAGTLDISTMILHGSAVEDVVSFHVCDVAPLGALRLHQARANAVEALAEGALKHTLEYYQDGTRPLPETISEMVKRSSPELREAFSTATTGFSSEVVGAVLRCLVRFRKRQKEVHANANFDPWGPRLRFFLTGGGSRSSFYRDCLAHGELEQQLAPFTRWDREKHERRRNQEGLLLEPMPLPDKLSAFPKTLAGDFDRISVAFGLAFGGENLMRITSAGC